MKHEKINISTVVSISAILQTDLRQAVPNHITVSFGKIICSNSLPKKNVCNGINTIHPQFSALPLSN